MVAALRPDWPVPPVFPWLARTGGVPVDEMSRVFNCGLGMVLVVSASAATEAMTLLTGEGETVYQIGVIEAGEGEARVTFTPPLGWLA
jgi:phosphoribosylformylglycinamidine cyclo-ligase